MINHDEKPARDRPQYRFRYDALAKVTGRARYAGEFSSPFPKNDLLYARLVLSTIPAGTILSIDSTAAEHAPGVVAVITPFNAPKLIAGKPEPPASRSLSLLQDKQVHYNEQPIGIVVAKTLEQARHGAELLKIRYEQAPAKLELPPQMTKQARLEQARWPRNPGKESPGDKRGDVSKGFAAAAVTVDETYITPIQYHNPMEPHATIAWWEGETLTVYDSTQYISGVKQSLARALNLPLDNVRVLCPYTGGGFGCKGSTWSHVPLAAAASKTVGKPVKLVLGRSQMFGPVGHRPTTVNHIRLGATAEGKLTAIHQDVVMDASVMEDFTEHSASPAKVLYASENNLVSEKVIDVNLGVATFMRAPGEAPGTAVLEIAMDELAEKLKMDPLQLRLVNYADKDPSHDRPWTSKNLKRAYEEAAERFGWSKRNAEPKQRIEGNELIGYGMATALYPANRSAAQALVRVLPGGKVYAASGSQDLGTGTYTMIAQTAADTLGIDITKEPSLVEAALGDSRLPQGPCFGRIAIDRIRHAGGAGGREAGDSQTGRPRCQRCPIAASWHQHRGYRREKWRAVQQEQRTRRYDSFADIIARNGNKPVEAVGSAEPGEDHDAFTSYSWGAVFAEVAVDRSHAHAARAPHRGHLRYRHTDEQNYRAESVDGWHCMGRQLCAPRRRARRPGIRANGEQQSRRVPRTREPRHRTDRCDRPRYTRYPFNPLGARGIGEIGITGAAAAVANAIYNATGKRIREYPITPDKIMRA